MIVQSTNFGGSSIVRCGVHTGTHNYGAHIHQFPEVVVVLEGSIESTCDGITETANAGDVIVISPFRIHSTYTPEYCKILISVFSNDFVSEFFDDKTIYLNAGSTVFHPSPAVFAYFCENHTPELARRFTVERRRSDYRTLKATLYAVLDEYFRKYTPSEKPIVTSALSATLLYISEHFREDLSLGSVAEALGYRPGYLSHCLDVLPGIRFPDLLGAMRVEYAKTLLSQTEVPLIDIAMDSGFPTERTFYRAFAKFAGVTPGAYRASLKNG